MWRLSAAKVASNGKVDRVEADMAGKVSEAAGSLSEGVERLERVVLAVKARQLAETRNAPSLKAVSDGFGFSPDEIWSKNYMTVGIGPSVRRPPPPNGGSTMFRLPDQPLAAARLQPPLVSSPSGKRAQGTIGDTLAKPVRRRSWLGRLVRGS